MAEIPYVLACDVGNNAIHFAHVHGEDVTRKQDMRLGELNGLGAALAKLWRRMPKPKKLVAGSVNPTALKALEAAAAEATREEVLVIGRDVPLPIETDVPNPELVGVDRLCCAVAAYDRVGEACVVADFGTAITIDCVNDEGVFLGGAILPGLTMSARGLHGGTARLPEVQPARPGGVFGKNTEQAIRSGLIRGARGALRELVESYATELRHWPIVIITGGDAKLVCGNVGRSDLVQAVVDDLALRGIAASYYRTLVK
ncbi:MAG: type III pantothenate kinase [Planctomycetota bacterium]|jgi:type III pantothenate kinase